MKRFFLLALLMFMPFLSACQSDRVGVTADDAGDSADPNAAADASTLADASVEPDRSDEVFEANTLLKIEIEIDTLDWDQLRTQARSFFDILGPGCLDEPVDKPYTWFQATVTLNGERIEQVGLRKKGFLGSLSETKPSLKIKFGEYVKDQRYKGMSRMTLNNAKQDRSFINQCLGYDLMRKAGVPAPRCNFAHITLNGQDMGVYVHIESIKTPFIARHFEDTDGNLYEGALSDFRSDWRGTFQYKNNSNITERTDIEAAITALATDDSELVAKVEALFDLDAFLTFWAMEVMLSHWDGYAGNTNNFYLYHDPTSDRFHFIPWGADATFASRDRSGGSAPKSVMAQGILARRLYLHPPTRDRYLTRMRELLDSAWDEAHLLAEIDRMEALISPLLSAAEQADLTTELGERRDFINGRRADLLAELDAGGADWPLPLREPPCMKPQGSIVASLTTTWGTMGAPNPFATGSGTMDATYQGNPVVIQQVGAMAGYGEKENSERAQIVVMGRSPDGTLSIIVIITSIERITPSTLTLDFGAAESYLLRYDPQVSPEPYLFGFLGNGTLVLQDAGVIDGAPVVGQIDAEIFLPPF